MKLTEELKGKCISCKWFCEATTECRKNAPEGEWPKTNNLMWCGAWAKSKSVEFEK